MFTLKQLFLFARQTAINQLQQTKQSLYKIITATIEDARIGRQATVDITASEQIM